MELRNGKKYSFKSKSKKYKMPKYIKDIINYLKQDFNTAGLELIQTDYCTLKF